MSPAVRTSQAEEMRGPGAAHRTPSRTLRKRPPARSYREATRFVQTSRPTASTLPPIGPAVLVFPSRNQEPFPRTNQTPPTNPAAGWLASQNHESSSLRVSVGTRQECATSSCGRVPRAGSSCGTRMAGPERPEPARFRGGRHARRTQRGAGSRCGRGQDCKWRLSLPSLPKAFEGSQYWMMSPSERPEGSMRQKTAYGPSAERNMLGPGRCLPSHRGGLQLWRDLESDSEAVGPALLRRPVEIAVLVSNQIAERELAVAATGEDVQRVVSPGTA